MTILLAIARSIVFEEFKLVVIVVGFMGANAYEIWSDISFLLVVGAGVLTIQRHGQTMLGTVGAQLGTFLIIGIGANNS